MSYTGETPTTIGEWADATFGKGTVATRAKRLLDEVYELIESGKNEVDEELADCYIVLATVAHTAGVDLQREVDRKMQINRRRKWAKTTAGCGQHVD